LIDSLTIGHTFVQQFQHSVYRISAVPLVRGGSGKRVIILNDGA
jgi:hypothetical protein